MNVKNEIEGKVIAGTLQKVAAGRPAGTVVGDVLHSVVSANVDWDSVLDKNPEEISKALAAAITALLDHWLVPKAVIPQA